MSKRVHGKKVANTGQYRKCLNHQVFEMVSVLSAVSATETVKQFSGTEYRMRSVDGKTCPITLFTDKFWDLILLKLTELVPYDKKAKRYKWDKQEEWYVFLSVKTVADCLNLSTSADSLTHLYDRIVEAIRVLRNISITVTKGRNSNKIGGYLEAVGVRECSDTDEECLTKSNAIFGLRINPELIDYIAEEKIGIYHFNHSWLYLPGAGQNTYTAAKRLGRHYSQNTYKRNAINTAGVQMKIGTLKKHLPSLNNKKEKDNRASLDRALSAIPGAKCVYVRDNQRISFEELTGLRLRNPQYDMVMVAVKYDDHPNSSDNKVTTDLIRKMNDDAAYVRRDYYYLADADKVIQHKGAVGNSPEKDAAPEEEIIP